jgi:hypothetical protein
MFRTNQRSYFDKPGGEPVEKSRQTRGMKHQLAKTAPAPLIENGWIYLAMITGGAIILLMILAEMKFFGT